MSGIKLYHFPGSLCSQKVKLVLAEKNLDWESHLVNWLTFENLAPDYMRLNPKGVVPTLVHNSKVVCDSVVIIRYLDRHFSEPRLTPDASALRKSMDIWIDLQNNLPMREAMYGNMRGIDGLVARKTVDIKEKLLPQLAQKHPDLKAQYTAKLKDVKPWKQTIRDVEKITQINSQIEAIMNSLEQQLSQSEWLCGSAYSLADAVWTAVLSRLDELGFSTLWKADKRPAIAGYLNRLKARPSYRAAVKNDAMPLPMILAGLRRIFLGF